MAEGESAENQLLGAGVLFGGLLLVHLPLLWPLGELALAWRVAKGYGALLATALLSVALLHGVLRLVGLRSDEGRGWNVKLVWGFVVAVALTLTWTALVALLLDDVATRVPGWAAALLHVGGLLICYGGFAIISLAWPGEAFAVPALFLFPPAYLVFALWSAGASFVSGWLARLLR